MIEFRVSNKILPFKRISDTLGLRLRLQRRLLIRPQQYSTSPPPEKIAQELPPKQNQQENPETSPTYSPPPATSPPPHPPGHPTSEMNPPWETDPNRAQWWNNPVQQQAPPPPPPPGANTMPGFWSDWTPPHFPPVAPYHNGWTPRPNLPPMNTWMTLPQFMAHNNTSTVGYGNPAYYPPPMPPGIASGGGPAPGGPASGMTSSGGPASGEEANTFPSERKGAKRKSKAERRLRKQLQQQQTQPQEQQNPQQQHKQQQEQQHRVPSAAQLPPQPPKAFPQVPASLPAIPPTAGKAGRKKRGSRNKAAENQLQPQQNPTPDPNSLPPPPTQPNPHPQRLPIPPLNRDAISPPSAASGGIPNPTPAYLAQAYLSPQRTSQPQPLLVIIDLNGTLLHRPSPRAPSTFIERPRAGEFLRECLDAFYVVIWSSARPDNVGKMVRQLLPEPAQRARVLATWGRDRFGLSAADYYQRTQCYKRLTKVWTDPGVAAAHPLAGGRWGQANTVLIDDSIEKARSEPFNAVTIPEFTGRKGTDEVLALVHEYLCVLSMQADVSAFVRTHPFKADLDTIAEYARLATEGYEAEGEAEGEATG